MTYVNTKDADTTVHPHSLNIPFVVRCLSAIYMHTFTYLCKFYIYVNFTHLCKNSHVNANTYQTIFTYVQIYSWVWPSVKVYLLLHRYVSENFSSCEYKVNLLMCIFAQFVIVMMLVAASAFHSITACSCWMHTWISMRLGDEDCLLPKRLLCQNVYSQNVYCAKMSMPKMSAVPKRLL